MIKSRSAILTDSRGEELPEDGLQLFDLIANGGDIHQFAAGCIPSHWHKELEVFVLSEGRIQVSAGDRTYSLQAGDGCFINAEVIHSFTADADSPCLYRSFVFAPDIIGGAPGSIFDTVYVRPLLESGVSFLKLQKQAGDQAYFQAFERAFLACAAEADGYEFQVRESLSRILLYIKSKTAAVSRTIPSIQEGRLKEMLIWIHAHLEKNISVAQIAETVSICPRECQRIFNQYLHYSPMEYVGRKRILTAPTPTSRLPISP
ncbi:MAG: cupin domain-containing protein [Clostridiales bacterium]|nr:cupin domain-containing protein [Clostridiales bacterium]